VIGRNPENELQKEVHAVNTKGEKTEEKNLVESFRAFEHRPVITCPYVGLELVHKYLNF
jgi:hypothetical protein